MRGRLIFVAVAIVAVVTAAVLRSTNGGEHPSTSTSTSEAAEGSPAPPGALRITFAYSPEKEKLLLPLIRRFNSEARTIRGRTIFVDARNVSSGDAESKLARGRLEVTAWSPASSLWGRLLNFEADRPFVANENPSLARTPLVIAMWEPLARLLGWPAKPVGFAEFLRVATSGEGWAQFGKPTYGRFKLGHTNPEFSTSGLSGVAGLYYAATGKGKGMTERDVQRPEVRARVRAIEQSIVHYGDTTLFFAEQMKAHGPGYVSAVAMEETTLLDFNRTRPRGLPRLVALYPPEGTFVSDNPFIVLNAPWVTKAQRTAARSFGAWLRQRLTPKLAAAYGFRPGDVRLPPLAPIDPIHGVDPAQPKRVLELPQPRVLAAIRNAWREDRKPANVMLVVDVSGSMSQEGRLTNAKAGLRVFLKQLSPRDRVGLVAFNEKARTLVPLAPFTQDAPELRATIHDLIPDGGTALYSATLRSLRAMSSLRDASRINAIVVLSDGADTSSSISLRRLVSEIEREEGGGEREPIRIFTIAYSAKDNVAVLGKIADASGGKAYAGNPEQIETVYGQISSFF